MNRVVSVVACGLSLAACGSISMPSMPSMPSLGFGGDPATGTATVRLESEPPGAEARTSGGQGCRTPCSMTVTARGDITVNFTLNGYLPQAVTAQVVAPDDIRGDGELAPSSIEPRIVPNPIFAALDPAPPPPPPQRRKPPPRKPPPSQAAAPPPQAMGMTPPPSSALQPFPSR
jgi:hypothetical protein